MSAKHNVNPHQLRMFIPVDEVVDTFDKGDSYWGEDKSPRQQWEMPPPESTVSNNSGEALRDRKLRQIEERKNNDSIVLPGGVRQPYDLDKARAEGNLPPVEAGSYDRPYLYNGHHRLALLERRQRETGHEQYVPVRWGR